MASLTLRKYEKIYAMKKIGSNGIERKIYYAIVGKAFHCSGFFFPFLASFFEIINVVCSFAILEKSEFFFEKKTFDAIYFWEKFLV